MSAAVTSRDWSLHQFSSEPSQLTWYQHHVARQRARWDHLTPEDRAEVEAIEAHLARERFGVESLDGKRAIRDAKVAYQAAIVKGDVAAAAEAKSEISRLQGKEKIAREVRRAAPARQAIRAAATDFARKEEERREAERAKSETEMSGIARELADAIVVLHKLRLAVPQRVTSRPAFQVWTRAMQLAAQDLETTAPNVAMPLASALHTSSF